MIYTNMLPSNSSMANTLFRANLEQGWVSSSSNNNSKGERRDADDGKCEAVETVSTTTKPLQKALGVLI
jgi:hypothetical protein